MIKTYWGLSEVEINQFWKSLEEHKNKKYFYLSLKEDFKEPYEYYEEKVKLVEPNFTKQMLIDISEDMIDFRDNSIFDDYKEYKDNNFILQH